ncbi:MAG: CsgG/HfaB family protein [Fidelibacterota bacterium]
MNGMGKSRLYLVLLAFIIGCSTVSETSVVLPKTLDSELTLLSTQISQSFSTSSKTDIAIVEFSDIEGRNTHFGRYIAEELTTYLYKSGHFNIVERQMLHKIMNEQEMSLIGMIDENSAVRLGHLLGVQAIVSGSLTDLGSSVKINARLISSETGQVFSVASVEIPKDETVSRLLYSVQPVTQVSEIRSLPENTFPDIQTEVDGILFKVLSCEKKGNVIKCHLQVINQDTQDRDLTLWFLPTNAWSDTGEKLGLVQLIFAGQRHRMRTADGWGGSSRNGGKLIAGIPTTMEIIFGETASDVHTLSLVEIKANNTVVRLKDIPVQ